MFPSLSPSAAPRSWGSGLPGLLAFLVGLAVVWVRGWSTTDLIWSLWLLGVALVGAAFYLAFFTTHVGGFHFIQSQFLLSSYPLGFAYDTMNRATLAEVVRRYWPALPSAFLARRYAFTRRAFGRLGRLDQRRGQSRGQTPQVSDPLAHRQQDSTTPSSKWDEMAESRVFGPYLQVMRMHVVIIAFSALHAARRESFAVFAAVYALYFFPWRLLQKPEPMAGTNGNAAVLPQESVRG